MDLRLSATVPATAEEREAVDGVLGPPESRWDGGQRTAADAHVAFGGHAARSRRHLLIPVLHAVQERVGWISPGALDYACERLTVPPAEAYGVASFYAMFRTTPSPRTVVHVCDDVACRANGAEALCEQMSKRFGDTPEGAEAARPGSANGSSANGSSANGSSANGTGVISGVTWQRSPCLGQCDRGSAALLQRAGTDRPRIALAPADPDRIRQALTDGLQPMPEPLVPGAGAAIRSDDNKDGAGGPPAPGGSAAPAPRLLARIGTVDPASLASYRAVGGYEMLRRALALGPQGVLREVRDAKLLGRGGAAFPTAVKWEAVAGNPVRPHYVVCNADESEPGTFKDRVLMEHDPYALVEALTIMGYACGAEQGYIYIRGEYPVAEARLAHAIAEARARGFLGDAVAGGGFSFDIEIRRGAGAYIAGEETALINSLEGKRAEPRNKPPFPATHGLFGKPTAVNNVETLLSVLEILRIGGPAYARIGTENSSGTRLWCLCGHVAAPGLYEHEFGATLREVIDTAGGVRDGRPLRAVLLGGAAGSFLRADQTGFPLTFEGAREAGATLGSGVVVAIDDATDLGALLVRIAEFFRDESCGQCVPCRIGTVRQQEALIRITEGRPLGSLDQDVTVLRDLGRAMRDASICGLGQTAPNAVESAIDQLGIFREEKA